MKYELFAILVVIGFFFRWLAAVSPFVKSPRVAEAIAWTCWLLAAIIWALTHGR